MRFGPTLLCSAVILFAAAPIWADRVDSPDMRASDSGQVSVDGSFGSTPLLGDWFGVATDGKFVEGQVSDAGPAFFIHDNVYRDGRDRWFDNKFDNKGDGSTDPVATPEPASLPLLAIGLFGLGFVAYRRKESQKLSGGMDEFRTRSSA